MMDAYHEYPHERCWKGTIHIDRTPATLYFGSNLRMTADQRTWELCPRLIALTAMPPLQGIMVWILGLCHCCQFCNIPCHSGLTHPLGGWPGIYVDIQPVSSLRSLSLSCLPCIDFLLQIKDPKVHWMGGNIFGCSAFSVPRRSLKTFTLLCHSTHGQKQAQIRVSMHDYKTSP